MPQPWATHAEATCGHGAAPRCGWIFAARTQTVICSGPMVGVDALEGSSTLEARAVRHLYGRRGYRFRGGKHWSRSSTLLRRPGPPFQQPSCSSSPLLRLGDACRPDLGCAPLDSAWGVAASPLPSASPFPSRQRVHAGTFCFVAALLGSSAHLKCWLCTAYVPQIRA